MRIAVTGAAGFAASHLMRALREENGRAGASHEQNEVFAWVRDSQEAKRLPIDKEHIYIGDITDAKQVRRGLEIIRPQQIYHLAAQASVGLSWKDPAGTMQVNSVGTLHMLEGIRNYAKDARILLVGSSEQYGAVDDGHLPITEAQPLLAGNPYSISKMAQELSAQLYIEKYNLDIIRVRSFNHIGPGQSVNFVIPDWCSQVAAIERGEQDALLKVGNISVKRDFTDVRDIVKAYILLMQKGATGEIYNVGSGVSHSLEQMLQMILRKSNVGNIRYEIAPEKMRPADIMDSYADVSKLKRATLWQPQYSLEQSVSDILQEMRMRREK